MSVTKGLSQQWEVKFSRAADKQLEKMDPSIRRSINRYIFQHLTTEENPRRLGKPLAGNLKEFWRYRIGDYRLICEIIDEKMVIIAIKIEHRSKVYKNVHFLRSSS